MQEEVKHYKVKSLGTTLRPNSVYYVKPNSQTAVLTYITDQTGVPYPLIDLTGVGNIQTVTGTGVTGTLTNPIVNISTFNSSQLGNLIQLSSTDGKLFVKPITSPDGSISIVNTLSELQIEVSEALQAQIQSALQPGNNVSELTNDAGYITSEDITTPTFQEVLNFNNSLVYALNFQGTYAGKFNTGLESVNALGIFSSMYNAGSHINSFGASSALYNTRDNVNAFGRGAGRNNNFFSVNLFGQEAEADDNNQTVFSKFVSSVSQFLARISYKNITANRKYELPDASGTIALTSDIPSTITIDANPTDGSSNAVSSNGVFDALAGKEPSITAGTISEYWRGDKTWQTFPTIPTVGTWGALNYPTWTTGTPFVKMTAAGTFALDTNTYLTSAVTSVGATSPITSSGGNTPTISTSMATNKLIGRSTAGTGVMEEITVGTGLSLTGGTLSSSVTGGIPHATASGTDTYTATIAGVTSYSDADAYLIRFTNGNTTSATLNINSLGAIPLYRNNDGVLIGGDIISGGEMLCIYNSTTNRFQVIGTAPNSLFAYVTNDDSVTLTKGMPVYAFSGTGDRMTVKRAFNTSDATSAQTVGLVLSTSIAANQKGLIMMQGLLDGLSILPTATWSDGDAVYLGATAGTITNVKPYAPNHLVYLGVVTTASNGSAGRLYVRVQNGYELQELHNVQAQSPSLNDTLWYDSAVSPAQWKTASIPTILGYTPGTVTSVAALTLATTGTDLSSTVANGTTTPVITLNVPTASASNRGALSSTDWNTFNNKQNNLRTFNTTQGIYYFEEFLGQSRHVDYGIGNNQGSSAYTATITNRTNQQGVAQHTTNANSTGQAGFTFVNGAFQFIGGGVITLEAYINITTLSTLAERFYTFFGYVTAANFANIPNTIVITYDEGGIFLGANASPNFKCVTRAGSTATTTITTIPIVASQWYKLRIVINANASSVEFYIDNVLVATHNTNIPATTTAMYIANGIAKNTGTTARSMQTDYFMYEQIFTNPR